MIDKPKMHSNQGMLIVPYWFSHERSLARAEVLSRSGCVNDRRPIWSGRLCCQGVELLCRGLSPATIFHLPFSDHVHEFDAGEKDSGAAKILEAEHWSGSAFNSSMVLLDNVVQVLDLAHDDPLPSSDINGFESRYIRAALIDGHVLGCPVPLDCLFEEPVCRGLVAMRPQQEIDGVACLVNGTIQILPLAPNLDVCLVHAPTPADLAFGAPEGLLQYGQQFDRPAMDGRMIDGNPALGHHLLQIPKTQRVSDIPAHTKQNHVQRIMQAL